MLNPLLIKEFRVQTRCRETYAVAIIYIFVISALTFSLLWEASTSERVFSPEYGREVFLAFVAVLIVMVCLICPAFTIGAISSEREHLTFDQLRVTLLKPRQILMGKAVPPLIYTLILLFASLPVATLIVPVGGISILEMASCYLIAFISAVAFSLTGLMWSSIFRSTRTSTAITYVVIGFFTFGTAIVPMILSGVFRVEINRVLLDLCTTLNPLQAVFSVLGRGRQFQLAGLSLWEITIAGYLIIPAIAVCVALLRFKRMRS